MTDLSERQRLALFTISFLSNCIYFLFVNYTVNNYI
jgi:hypothetical protein